MITTKHGIKFSLTTKKKIKITPAIKKYFEEVEKKIAEEIDKLDMSDFCNDVLVMTPDGIEKVKWKDFYK